jgi:hydroxyacylglutathione hydrolase
LKSPWKRRLLIAAALLVVLIAIPVGLVVSAFVGMRPLQEREIGTVRVLKDGFVAVGVIDVGNGHVALIDAGNDASGKVILAELARRHLGPEAVSDIFLTHGHGDHVAAAKLFPAANVYIGAADVGLAQGREGSHGPITRFLPSKDSGVKALKGLANNTIVTTGTKNVRAFLIPGHTAGSAAYLVDGVLFLGDSAGCASDGHVVGAPYAFSDSQPQNQQSLKKLAEELVATHGEVKALVFAHSAALDSVQPLLDFAAKI